MENTDLIFNLPIGTSLGGGRTALATDRLAVDLGLGIGFGRDMITGGTWAAISLLFLITSLMMEKGEAEVINKNRNTFNKLILFFFKKKQKKNTIRKIKYNGFYFFSLTLTITSDAG